MDIGEIYFSWSDLVVVQGEVGKANGKKKSLQLIEWFSKVTKFEYAVHSHTFNRHEKKKNPPRNYVWIDF